MISSYIWSRRWLFNPLFAAISAVEEESFPFVPSTEGTIEIKKDKEGEIRPFWNNPDEFTKPPESTSSKYIKQRDP